LQKIFKENGLGVIIVILLVAYGVYYLSSYLTGKGSYGMERMNSTPNSAYSNGATSTPSVGGNVVESSAEPLGQNEVYSSVNDVQTITQLSDNTIQDPSELLPKDSNSQWAQLNPNGGGELSNINLLKAGYNIGIDTIGQSLRNSNQQIY
jgi:hypothetical protein